MQHTPGVQDLLETHMAIQRSLLTIRGWVGTTPEYRKMPDGKAVTTFRIADSVRRRDPETGTWSDSKTTWYTVQIWGDHAANVAESIRRSDPVIVIGHPWLDEWTAQDGGRVSTMKIDAESIAPDLSFGTTYFKRTARDLEAAPVSADGVDDPSASTPTIAQDDDGDVPDTIEGLEDEGLTDKALAAQFRTELVDDTRLSTTA